MRTKAACWRAELVDGFVAGGGDALDRMADVLGLDPKPGVERPEPPPRSPGPTQVPPPPQPARDVVETDSTLAPVPFLRAVQYIAAESPPERNDSDLPASPPNLQPLQRFAPPWPPLLPWPRLNRMLAPCLRRSRITSEVDADKLTDRLARGVQVRYPPRRYRMTTSGRLRLLVDRSRRMMPFWRDLDWLQRRLGARLGPQQLVVVTARSTGDLDRSVDRLTADSDPFLVASDLGSYGDRASQHGWKVFLRRLRRGGVDPWSLLPAPRRRWPERPFRARGRRLLWDRQVAADPAPDAVEQLLRLVAFGSELRPGLLRAARLSLPARRADAGTEHDAWNYAGVDGRSAVRLWLDRQLRERLQEGAEESAVVSNELIGLHRNWAASEPRDLWLEDVLTIARTARDLLTTDELRDAEHLFQWICGQLYGDQTAGLPANIERWFRSYVTRAPSWTWADQRYGAALSAAFQRLFPNADLPPGFRPELLKRLPREPPVRTIAVIQEGDTLKTAPFANDRRYQPGETGSVIALLPAGGKVFLRPRGGVATPIDPVVAPPSVYALNGGTIESDSGRLELAAYSHPDWADAIGRDGFGLWAEVVANAVRFRLRWIPPGRFLYGSPRDEAGRADWEHEQGSETIEHGFWIGDTPVTQTLYEAIVGENPSRFKSPDRPVEQVSWDEAVAFLEKLGGVCPGLKPRLPLELEWEYACRAGTTTSTYAGQLVIEGTNNGPLLDDIAWYGGNSGVEFDRDDGVDSSGWENKQHEHSRAGSRRVATKLPNGLGLYDMLGNVWEWCADLGEDGSNRVFRGGSWHDFARSVRSASRDRDAPSLRWFTQGFRLVRGQGAQPGKQESRGRAGRGTSPRVPGEGRKRSTG